MSKELCEQGSGRGRFIHSLCACTHSWTTHKNTRNLIVQEYECSASGLWMSVPRKPRSGELRSFSGPHPQNTDQRKRKERGNGQHLIKDVNAGGVSLSLTFSLSENWAPDRVSGNHFMIHGAQSLNLCVFVLMHSAMRLDLGHFTQRKEKKGTYWPKS
jgi:hypothetical protein